MVIRLVEPTHACIAVKMTKKSMYYRQHLRINESLHNKFNFVREKVQFIPLLSDIEIIIMKYGNLRRRELSIRTSHPKLHTNVPVSNYGISFQDTNSRLTAEMKHHIVKEFAIGNRH